MLYLNVNAYVATGGCYFRLTDGANVSGITNVYSSTGDRVSHIIGEFKYDSAQPSVEFSLQGAVWNGSASCIVGNNVPTGIHTTPFTFSLYKMDATPVGSDNMGDHVATQNIVTGSHWISGDGDSEGLRVDNSGRVGIGTANPTAQLDVNGTIKATAADLPIQYVSSTGAAGAPGMVATATCPANYKVIGGGCKVNVTYDSRIFDSSPSAGGTAWSCAGAHAYAPTTYTMTAHAICLKVQ
ncbi:MAG TPA: hypothetical protein PL182_13775 [Pseudobdellovibrionaceae bacterium]|nr:hypothetical protein [Pseudobdellovibrionaceae bacterium]